MRYAKKAICLISFCSLLAVAVSAYSQGSVRLPSASAQKGAATEAADAKAKAKETAKPTQPASRPAPQASSAASQGEDVATEEGSDPAATEGSAGKEAKTPPPNSNMVYLNVQDEDLRDVVKQISKATGRNFIIDDKVKGKVTILSERMMTKEEAYQTFLSALEMANFTTVTGPGGVIKIIGRKDAQKSPIPTYVDSTPQTDSMVTRLITLQNISALEMSSVIKDLVSGSMFAYPSTNTLVITDSGSNIDRLMKIIKELDQEGPQQTLEIIPINYADAKDVASTVLSLFDIDAKGKTVATTQARAGARPAGGASLEDIAEVSRIIADDRTNSLIVLASKRGIQKVRDVIAKLDVPMGADDGSKIHVHYLKYANAKEMAETLATVTSGVKAAKAPAGAKGAAGGETSNVPLAVASLGEDVKIGADESTNALIITASAKDYKILVDELISKLDVPRRQVYLESVVMELGVTKGSTAGATGYGGGMFGSTIGFGGSSAKAFNPAQFFSPSGLMGTPGLLGGLLSRDTISIDVPAANGGTQEMTIPAFAAFLNFLSTNQDTNIVSTPNILTLDNQKASIDVSKTIYANKVTQSGTTGFQTTEPSPLEAGLTLEITPQITEGDAVRLEIKHKLSNFTGDPDPNTGAAPQTKREIQTTVVAMDGQTVVLGGLMQDIDNSYKSKVPIIGDIPVLGWLFQYRTKTADKTNLLIFITPNVIHDPTDFAEITKRKIEQRNAFIESNYGKSRQKNIKQLIATHRADLLEFTPEASAIQSSSKLQSSAKPLPVSSTTTTPTAGTYSPPVVATPPPAPKAVAPVTNPGKPDVEAEGGVDLAY